MMLLLLWCGMSSLLFSETVGCFCYYGMSSLLNGMSTLYYIVQGSCKHVAAVCSAYVAFFAYSPLSSALLSSPLFSQWWYCPIHYMTWIMSWWSTLVRNLASSPQLFVMKFSSPLLWCHRSSKCTIKVPEYRTVVCLKKQFKLVMMYLLLWISGI